MHIDKENRLLIISIVLLFIATVAFILTIPLFPAGNCNSLIEQYPEYDFMYNSIKGCMVKSGELWISVNEVVFPK